MQNNYQKVSNELTENARKHHMYWLRKLSTHRSQSHKQQHVYPNIRK